MLTLLRRTCSKRPRLLTRNYASIVPVTSAQDTRSPPFPPLKGTIDPPPTRAIASPDGRQTTSNESAVIAPVRLGNRISVRADHGLYAFFRKKEPATGQTLKGEAQYETLGGSIEMDRTRSGRSWKASELRLKSFEDLHTLWYILLRERNLLATQEEEVRRLGVMKVVQTFNTQIRMCRKSMARIKYVMNERRLAYEGAVKLAEEEKTAHITNLVLKEQLAEHQTEREKLFRRQRRARIRAVREAKRNVENGQIAEVQTIVDKQDTVTTEPAVVEVKTDDPIAAAAQLEQPIGNMEHDQEPPKARPSQSDRESASETAAAALFGTHGRRR